jgi:hypothetical protein
MCPNLSNAPDSNKPDVVQMQWIRLKNFQAVNFSSRLREEADYGRRRTQTAARRLPFVMYSPGVLQRDQLAAVHLDRIIERPSGGA